MLYFLLSGQLERTKNYIPRKQFWRAVNVLEYKFLSIPIAFFLLRMPTCIINLLYVYIDIGQIPQPLVYLSVSKQHLVYVHYFFISAHIFGIAIVCCVQGVGDSGQGFVNVVLFVLLTKPVRDAFLQLICCRSSSAAKTTTASDEENKLYESNDEAAPLIPSNPDRNRRSLNRTNSRSGTITPDFLTASRDFTGSRNSTTHVAR